MPPLFRERILLTSLATSRLEGPVSRSHCRQHHTYVSFPVPLFWTQSGAGLKPAPQLSPETTHHQNLKALSRHFKRTLSTYGPHVSVFDNKRRTKIISWLQTAVNLAEKHGREGVLTNAYREYVEEAQLSDVKYVTCKFRHGRH
jgi:hypothetical protein